MKDLEFGLAHIKQQGAPAHPEDIYIHCGCAKCEAKWQKQLKAYNDFFAEQIGKPEHHVKNGTL